MYSDEQIRQIILDTQSESENIYDKARNELHSATEPRFVEIALAMLDEEDYEPVRAAIVALRNLFNFNPPQFLPRVTQFLEVPSHCASAIWFIWSLGNSTYVPSLIRFLAADDENVRYEALKTIARYGHHDLLEIALHMLDDISADVRIAACSIIAKYQDIRVVPALISKLNDSEIDSTYSVASIAAHRLGEIGDPRAVQPLMDTVRYGDEESAFQAIWAIWKIEQAASLEFLLEQSKHPFEQIRREVMNILAKILDVASVDTLIWVAQNDSSLYVQSGAIYVLEGIGTSKALKIVDEWKAKHRSKP